MFYLVAYSQTLPTTIIWNCNDDQATTPKNTAVEINVLDNDSEQVALLGDIQIVTAPANGSATTDGIFIVTYTPNNGFVGMDSLVYSSQIFLDPIGIIIDQAVVRILVTGTTTSIVGVSRKQIRLNAFSLPTSNFIDISIDDNENSVYSLSLYDLNGREVRKIENITSKTIQIQRNGLPEGFYTFRVIGNNGYYGSKKFKLE